MSDWWMWIEQNCAALNAGEKIVISEHLLGHPRSRPDLFSPVVGYPDGQTCDWAVPLEGGKRVHAQCFSGPKGERLIRVHIDKWDPNRSFGHFVMHSLFETPAGPLLGFALVVGALARAQ